jgi:hypothetical protein
MDSEKVRSRGRLEVIGARSKRRDRPAGVSVAAAVSADTLIGGALAQSARKTFLSWFPSPSWGLGFSVAFQTYSKKQRHEVCSLTPTGLGEGSHLLSKGFNLDTQISDIANVVEWQARYRVRRSRSTQQSKG